MSKQHPLRERRGASAIEFALSTLLWLPLLIGLITVGFKVIQADRIFEVVRDTGHMYAYGTDFSQPGNQALAQRLAIGYDLSSSGTAVLVFTIVKLIGPTDCTTSGAVPGGQTPNSTNCPNLGHYVIAQRQYVGNTSLFSSDFGTPAANLLDAQGNVSLPQQATNAGVQTSSFSNLLTLTPSQFAYMTEGYFSSTDLYGKPSGGVYDRAIF